MRVKADDHFIVKDFEEMITTLGGYEGRRSQTSNGFSVVSFVNDVNFAPRLQNLCSPLIKRKTRRTGFGLDLSAESEDEADESGKGPIRGEDQRLR